MTTYCKMITFHAMHGRHATAGTQMRISLYDSLNPSTGRHHYFWKLENAATGHIWFTELTGQDSFISMSCMLANRYRQQIGKVEQADPHSNFVQEIRFELDDCFSDYQLSIIGRHV